MKAKPQKLSPDAVTVSKDCETLERELIFGLSKSYRFYREIRDIVCPFDSQKRIHRYDFKIKRYNTLYQAIDSFWRRFDRNPPGKDMFIPPHHLSAYIIDWVNKRQIPDDAADKLVKEIQDEIPLMDEITLESSRALAQSDGFRQWLSSRELDHMVGKIQALQSLGKLTPASIPELFNQVSAPLRDGFAARSLGALQKQLTDEDELIGPGRALCIGKVALVVGATGTGKSGLLMQMSVAWAIGRPAFGFVPKRSLKILIVQAENDDGDVVEARDGVFKGFELTPEERTQCEQNIHVISTAIAGEQFIRGLEKAVVLQRPDLVIIDPALAYIAGDSRDQSDVKEFLRLQLIPILERHRCGCVLVHHTNKPSNMPERRVAEQDAYAGSGSNEWANCPRIVITLRRLPGSNVFELRVTKRGERLKWTDSEGQPTIVRFLRQSGDPEQIFWSEIDSKDVPATARKRSDKEVLNTVLALIPGEGKIAKNEIIELGREHGVSKNQMYSLIKELVIRGLVLVSNVKQPKGPAKVLLALAPTSLEIQ
ncbi:MAG: hypothetical protein JWM68_1370 [Verrucomicrobiales bacterium]|nr:hypothetical protein [Verrucomicrobiales bacterium]